MNKIETQLENNKKDIASSNGRKSLKRYKIWIVFYE